MIILLVLCAANLRGQVLETKEDAFRQIFVDCDTVIREVLFLDEEQCASIERSAKSKIESKIVTYYRGIKDSTTTGLAFIERNVVRTKPETFLVLLRPDGTVKTVHILAFHEPFDYLPTPNWLRLFDHKELNADLWPNRGIHNVTGATLTVRAITKGVRKILAIYKIAIAKKEMLN